MVRPAICLCRTNYQAVIGEDRIKNQRGINMGMFAVACSFLPVFHVTDLHDVSMMYWYRTGNYINY